jgi:two-component system phosphate regulon sensor histidine kinase PhoR
MIEIRYKGILFLQALFLFVLGAGLYQYFKSSFALKIPSSFWSIYLIIWVAFIVFNLIFIKFFAFPSSSLIKKLRTTTPADEMSWAIIEDTLSQRDNDLKRQKEEFEKENFKYKTLLDSLHDPVCIFSKEESLLYSNNSYNRLFSLPSKRVPAPLIEITRNLDFQNFVKKALSSGDLVKLSDFTFNQSDSYKHFYDIKIFPLLGTQHHLCLMHEVTERKMADQVREDFVSNFSHEVRTPLTILSGQMQNLKSTLSTQPNFEAAHAPIFEKIDNNARRLLNLFNDLLRLSSVEKKKDLQKENVDITNLIESLGEDLSLNYRAQSIKYSFDLREPVFYIDYNLFEQVMINLIDNAFKYSKKNGHIHITTFREEQNGNFHSVLEISDDGIGISEDHIHRVFERFFRVDSSRSSEIGGTGLGLSIVKHIIQKHEGKIRAQSNMTGGTKFILSIPVT